MREIIFRGKRKDNGEWIDGYLVKLGKESFSDPERYGICDKAIPIAGLGVCYNLMIYEVVPSTVGQYTGFTDKNGKRIFEGHILAFSAYGSNYLGHVENIEGNYGVTCDNAYPFLNTAIKEYGAIIVGNIHDNPDTLKADEPETEDTRSRIYADFMKSCKL